MHRVDPQCLWMHPEDARARGIQDGQEVLVWNDRGRVRIPAKLTERMMAGVVAMSQGAWYAPDEDGTDPGEAASMC